MSKALFLSIVCALFLNCAGIYAAMIGQMTLLFRQPPGPGLRGCFHCVGQDEYIDDAIRELKIKAKKMKADAIILKRNESNHNSPKRMVTIIKSYKLTKAKMFIVQLEIPKVIVEATIIRLGKIKTIKTKKA